MGLYYGFGVIGLGGWCGCSWIGIVLSALGRLVGVCG